MLEQNQNQIRVVSGAMERKQKEELEKEQKREIKAVLIGNSEQETSNFREGVEHGKKTFFPLLFACAIASDVADFVPIVGTIVKLITLPILWYNFYIKAKAPGHLDDKYKVEVSWKVRLLFRVLGIADIIPIINVLPLTTISVLIVWLKTRKIIREKENELAELNQQKTKVAAYSS